MKVLLLVLLHVSIYAADFKLIKHDTNTSEPTLLVIGGIHGDEPGGYFASALLSKYTITKGNLWVVPNLNQKSITANHRGLHGDMNRKFSNSEQIDKDTKIVQQIKEVILDKQVDMVLNLHDGHGFYREKHESVVFNPNAWGQTCVIDQCLVESNSKFKKLELIAKQVSSELNKNLIEEHHTFNVRNTNTKLDDEQMQLSLTFFSVTNHKPAFAIETSKDLSTLSQKVFYQLKAIESFMKIMNISYTRNFDLSLDSVTKELLDYGNLRINGKLLLPLTNIRKSLSYIPLQSKSNEFVFSHVLGNVKKTNNIYEVYIGNIKVVNLYPEKFKMGTCTKEMKIIVDNVEKLITIPSEFFVDADFEIRTDSSYRVNIIGYTDLNKKNENRIRVAKRDLSSRFSIDKTYNKYRVEIYDNNQFCGMVLLNFK